MATTTDLAEKENINLTFIKSNKGELMRVRVKTAAMTRFDSS
jgi:hypothetical protein